MDPGRDHFLKKCHDSWSSAHVVLKGTQQDLAEFLSLLREGLDGDVSSTAGRQALGHLLHASSFDGAPEVPPAPQYDYVLVIRDFDGTPPTSMPSLPPTTPIRIVDRRALPDPEIPLGLVAANLTSFITALGPSARTELDTQLRVQPRWYRPASPVLQLTTTPTQAEQLEEIVRGLTYLDLMTLGFGELDPALRSQGRAFRGGELQINKLQLVDAFGAVRQLVSSDAPHDCTLPPRLTHWARVQSRFTRADAPVAAIAPDADAVNSPVAGYLVYDAIEHALEFFDQSGAPLGQLRHHRSTNEVLWEGSPSRTQVSAITQPILSVIDQALRAGPVAPSTDTALLAALNLFSKARLSVAPHHATDDHLAMLCGRPIVVLRLRLELQLTGIGLSDQPAPGNVVLPDKVKVRLGSADQMDDGLLGFFLQGSDGWHLHVDPRHAKKTWELNQVVHPVISRDTTLDLVPRYATNCHDKLAQSQMEFCGKRCRWRIHSHFPRIVCSCSLRASRRSFAYWRRLVAFG
jgi:hypothetical protein